MHKQIMQAILISSTILMAASSHSENLAPPNVGAVDLSVGGYFWFAALNQKCREPSSSRDAAIERFRKQFFTNLRNIGASLPSSQATDFMSKVDNLEKNGPPKQTADHINGILARGSQEEIEAMCASAEKDINQQMQIQDQLMQARGRAIQMIQTQRQEKTPQ